MKIIGLCGKSGSGKGSVANLLLGAGIPVLDTDKLYHSLINDPHSACTKAIFDAFGSSALDAQGRVDRKALRQMVFGEENKEKWLKLNAISHAFVRTESEKWIEKQRQNSFSLVCLDVPLLFESRMNEICHVTLAVLAPHDKCIERIIQRDGIDYETAKRRLNAQLTDEQLTALCQYTISNDGTPDELADKVHMFLSKIQFNNQ